MLRLHKRGHPGIPRLSSLCVHAVEINVQRSRLRLMELLHERDDTSKTRTAMENVVGELEQVMRSHAHKSNA